MEWRGKISNKSNLNENKSERSEKPIRSEKPERYFRSERSERSENSVKNTEFKNAKSSYRFEDQNNSKNTNKFAFQNKRNGNNISLPRFKSADEIDTYLSSGKYFTVQKKNKLLEIKEKLLKYPKKNDLTFNEMSFPSLSGSSNVNSTNDSTNDSPNASTCWGSKLPESFYDTSVPFNTKFKPKLKQSQIVNSEISNDDDEYDSYDEYLDDNYDEFDDEGY